MLFNYFLTTMSVLDRDNIVNELYNPTYFFPIIGVLLSGLTVYIFGFTKTTKNPPTLQLLAYDKEDKKAHNQVINRKEKSKAKDVKKVNTTSSKQKLSSEKVNHRQKEVTTRKPTTTTTTTTKVNETTKVSKKESRKAKESIDSAIDVSTDGQWIEAISRKKSRKMKEEAAKSEATKNEAKKRPVETPKMNGDAGKDEVKASSPEKSDIKSDEPKAPAMSSAATKKRRARLE
ncbi:uncharacterized protein LOC141848800 [Brevipalpus obovatus]|uniref:uncharacterized protein LOC141848800 n=1 Tax=Brevipalpus obovatus TaxID=246614 RepID=UPI003D9E6CAC